MNALPVFSIVLNFVFLYLMSVDTLVAGDTINATTVSPPQVIRLDEQCTHWLFFPQLEGSILKVGTGRF